MHWLIFLLGQLKFFVETPWNEWKCILILPSLVTHNSQLFSVTVFCDIMIHKSCYILLSKILFSDFSFQGNLRRSVYCLKYPATPSVHSLLYSKSHAKLTAACRTFLGLLWSPCVNITGLTRLIFHNLWDRSQGLLKGAALWLILLWEFGTKDGNAYKLILFIKNYWEDTLRA